MPDRRYRELEALLRSDQAEGRILPKDLLDLLDISRQSVAIEGFRKSQEGQPIVVPHGTSQANTSWDYVLGATDWPTRTDTNAPDWFFLRPKLMTTQHWSRITGQLRPTADNRGIKFIADAVGGLARVCHLKYSIFGQASHTMSGAISWYRGEDWPNVVRQTATPFDTGIIPSVWTEYDQDGSSTYPFVMSGSDIIVMPPNHVLYPRLEYFGQSNQAVGGVQLVQGAVDPPTYTLNSTTSRADDDGDLANVWIRQFTYSLVTLGVVDSYADTLNSGGYAYPGDSWGFYDIFSDANSRASGLITFNADGEIVERDIV